MNKGLNMATNAGTVSVDASGVLGELTVTVEMRGVRRAILRLVLGCWIIRFGAWIAGVRVVNLA